MIRVIYGKCREHAKQYNVSIFSVLFDYLHARLFYGFCGEDYFLNTTGFALKNFQKKQFFSHKKWETIRKDFNDVNFAYILNNKVETLKYFSKFIHHGWCYPKEHSNEQFNQFCDKYHRIICKPITEEGGKGIELYHRPENANGGGV